MTDNIRAKLDYEFGVIREKGFISYFLIVWDYTNYARKRGMRCVARGSAAGSLVAYVLGITNVDPLRYDLLFERFLNPERMSMPDIDMDFPDDRREEVIRYVADKYGWDCVAQIVTFNTMAAKAAIRDVGRVMGLQNEADRLARLIPTGPNVSLNGAMEQVKELASAYKQDPNANRIIEMARQLEGTVRGVGIHAAGVLVSREPLAQTVPLQYRDYKDPNPWLVSQYEQAHLEELGLLKFDFLGLSNLTILQNCQEFIRQTRGIEIDLDRLDDTDAKTYALLGEGETTGVFQLESGAMRQYVRELKPTSIEDITAMVALYRPGPMDSIPDFIAAKHGRKQITYLHPALEPLLHESYGVIVYQDQVLQIAVQLAGFSWGEVDKFRKAMSKKLKEEMATYQEKFISGCKKNGIDAKTADKIFSFILPFAGYGFNKAHACAYAWVAYQTAYLKANYTAEFMAATLTTEAGDGKKVIAAIEECRRMGVEILPPDVNKSGSGFTVEALPSENGEPRWGPRGDHVGAPGRPRAHGAQRPAPAGGRRGAQRPPRAASPQRRRLPPVQLVPIRLPHRRQAGRARLLSPAGGRLRRPSARGRRRAPDRVRPRARHRSRLSRSGERQGAPVPRQRPQGRGRRRRRLRHAGAPAAVGASVPRRPARPQPAHPSGVLGRGPLRRGGPRLGRGHAELRRHRVGAARDPARGHVHAARVRRPVASRHGARPSGAGARLRPHRLDRRPPLRPILGPSRPRRRRIAPSDLQADRRGRATARVRDRSRGGPVLCRRSDGGLPADRRDPHDPQGAHRATWSPPPVRERAFASRPSTRWARRAWTRAPTGGSSPPTARSTGRPASTSRTEASCRARSASTR